MATNGNEKTFIFLKARVNTSVKKSLSVGCHGSPKI